jgi:hypothetical protein
VESRKEFFSFILDIIDERSFSNMVYVCVPYQDDEDKRNDNSSDIEVLDFIKEVQNGCGSIDSCFISTPYDTCEEIGDDIDTNDGMSKGRKKGKSDDFRLGEEKLDRLLDDSFYVHRKSAVNNLIIA